MNIEDFFDSPSEEWLDLCTKEQLLKIAEHYEIDIGDKRLKDRVKAILKSNLFEIKVLTDPPVGPPVTALSQMLTSGLTFEQQKELLMIQLDHDKFKLRAELDKEKIRQQTEQAKLDMEQTRLSLVREGRLSAGDVSRNSSDESDVLGNLRLVPKFSEKDPESFFSLFERVADVRNWPDTARTLMLQCVLTGRAQEAYSALSDAESKSYGSVKAAVLRAYELVPEAYRQRFRTWKKGENQSHLEFARDLNSHFTRWYSASEVNDFEGLCELMVLEQFKNSIPVQVATYVSEQKAKNAGEAPALADEYVLTHRPEYRSVYNRGESWAVGGVGSLARQDKTFIAENRRNSGLREQGRVCNYCHKRGHWKADCHLLKQRPKSSTFEAQVRHVKPAALSAPARKAPVVSEELAQSSKYETRDYDGFEAFVSDGFVSLPGSNTKVAVKILRDTGAKDSFVLDSVLGFSPDTDTGNCVLVQGMGLTTLCVPLHKVNLSCSLVVGDVHLGLRPALPIDGIDVILGNDLAGNRVWADGFPPIKPRPVIEERENCEQEFPEVFTACAVTRAVTRARADALVQMYDGDLKADFHVLDYFSVTQEELASEQRADAALSGLFDQVRPSNEAKSATLGYFLKNKVLVRKWVPQDCEGVGEAVVQVVVPTKYRNEVLKCSHDQTGHLGVGKTYHHILRYFFWPRLKRDVAAYIKTCHICQVSLIMLLSLPHFVQYLQWTSHLNI